MKYKVNDKLLYDKDRYLIIITKIVLNKYYYTYMDLKNSNVEKSYEVSLEIEVFDRIDSLRYSLKHILKLL